jgi:YD repeat-containing protein
MQAIPSANHIPTPATVPVAIYTRVSTANQVGGRFDSCESQAAICRDHITKQTALGWCEVACFSDPAYSGSSMNRPGIRALMRLIEAGEVKSVTGTAVVPEHRQTSVDSTSGFLTASVYSLRSSDLSSPTSAPRWSKVTTDWAGRKVKEERPAPPGASPSTFTKQYFFNSSGQFIKTTETGLADTLMQYDAQGELQYTGLDLNANGSLDLAGTDRVTEVRSQVYNDTSAGVWYLRNRTYVYNQASSGTALLQSDAQTRLVPYPGNLSEFNARTVYTQARAYDVFGNLTVRTGTSDRTTKLGTLTTDLPDSSVDEVVTTLNGRKVSQKSAQNLTRNSYYDALGRLVKETDPRTDTSSTARLGYHTSGTGAIGQLAWREDTAGNRTDYTYESSTGRLSTMSLPAPASGGTRPVLRSAYTTRGELYRQWGNGTYPVEYAYNDYGERTSQSTYRGGSGWDGTTWPGSPGTADTTIWAFDPASGTLTSQTDAAGRTVAYTYNSRSQLLTRQWARILSGSTHVTTTYAYAATTAELTGVDYNDGTPDLTYTYNRLGQTATVADATGTRTFNYSATTGQLQQEDLGSFLGSRSVTYQYDTAGTGTKGRLTYLGLGLTSAPGGEYNFTYGYDSYGRMNQVWNFTYTYLANSNLISGVADSQTSWTQTRTYEANRDLLDVIETKWGAASKAKFDYASDYLGRRTQVAKAGELYARYSANGLDTFYGYNDKSELTAEVTKLGGSSTILTGRDDAYTYDPIGNRLTKTHNGNAAAYTPNELNQYVQRVVPGVIDITGLAPALATVTVGGSSTGVTRHNDWYYKAETATNTSAAVGTSLTIASNYGGAETRSAFLPLTPEPFTYDLDGNLLSDGRWDYVYDAENRLITMQTRASVLGPIPNAEARRLEFTYDYLGRRVQKTVRGGWNGTTYATLVSDTKYAYNGWNLLGEYEASTLSRIRGYVWGLDWSGTLQGAGGVGGLLHVRDTLAAVNYRPAFDGSGNLAGLMETTAGSLAAAYEYDAYPADMGGSNLGFELSNIIWASPYHAVQVGFLNTIIVDEPYQTSATLARIRAIVDASPVSNLTEFGRVVHAEMEALLSCARKGVSTRGATLYSTTFPCHNCAKHIIAAGIERVVFVEPYRKSRAMPLHDDGLQIVYPKPGDGAKMKKGKVRLETFFGVGPRRFFDLFSMSLGAGDVLRRKERDTGSTVAWSDFSPRVRMTRLSYLQNEQVADRAFLKIRAVAAKVVRRAKVEGRGPSRR